MAVAVLLLGAAACGGLEIPSQPGGKTLTRSASSTTQSGDALVFVNASAVTVGRGDTVYGLSRRHRVSARDIIVANNLQPPYELIVGQRIVLPRGTVHTVKSGETLYRIAKTYDATVYEIARANAIGPPYTIFVDQKLRIPGTVQASVQSAARSSSGGNSASTGQTQAASVPVPDPKPAAPPVAVPTPPPSSGSGFIWPANGRVISSFGPKSQGLHNDGINIAAAEGETIVAAENGVVAYAGNELRGFGNLILLKHANGFVTAYAHASELLVKRGDKVQRGQAIALVGSTGNVASPQLHFEVRQGKKPLDPQRHLPARAA
ncbi:MAG: M23 family metallopeptidase [Rhodospirillales bacterium]